MPAEPGQSERCDYEYKRNGTANLFVSVAPQAGWRHVEVTERRTKLDYAERMRDLVDVHFPDADMVRVVLDNLNTHRPAALYEAFAPAEARRVLRRPEWTLTIRLRMPSGFWVEYPVRSLPFVGTMVCHQTSVGVFPRAAFSAPTRPGAMYGIRSISSKLNV